MLTIAFHHEAMIHLGILSISDLTTFVPHNDIPRRGKQTAYRMLALHGDVELVRAFEPHPAGVDLDHRIPPFKVG